jgi:hypothetical protein
MSRVCVVLCVCVCIYRDGEQYVCVYTCVYVSTYTHIHTHKHTHTHTRKLAKISQVSTKEVCFHAGGGGRAGREAGGGAGRRGRRRAAWSRQPGLLQAARPGALDRVRVHKCVVGRLVRIEKAQLRLLIKSCKSSFHVVDLA